MIEGTRPAAAASVRPVSERELADWRAKRGERVLERLGRFWRMSRPGFWEPVHWLAGFRAEEVRRPAICLGFRAVLAEEDGSRANAAMPVHVLEGVPDWGAERYRRSGQNRLRKAARVADESGIPLSSAILAAEIDLVEVVSPEALECQGHAVLVSSLERTGVAKPPSREGYVDSLRRVGIGGPAIVLAGFRDERLVAYMSGWAVGSTAYSHNMLISSEALSSQVGTALVFAFVEACQRGGQIERVVNGQHSLEEDSLSAYKDGIGFPVRRFPAIARLAPGLGPVMRRFRPYVAYRVTGRTP